MNAGEYSITIDKLMLTDMDEDAQTEATMTMWAKMISGTKIVGDYLKDSDKELIVMKMNIDLLDKKIPVDAFIDSKKKETYLGTDFATETVNAIKEYNSDVYFDPTAMELLEDKYILITEEDIKRSTNSKSDKSLAYINLDWNKIFREYINTLDSSSFEKKGNTIKWTFSKKELKSFIKYAEENSSEKEKKAVKELEKIADIFSNYEETHSKDNNEIHRN
ncbi:hypothetical protein [Enterococcus sp. DIV0756]|uniref:hypothetical protein n=1 Tax=Enterococcus sp. DIV0756 TaxID=2774636 RepID=UPI003F202BBC